MHLTFEAYFEINYERFLPDGYHILTDDQERLRVQTAKHMLKGKMTITNFQPYKTYKNKKQTSKERLQMVCHSEPKI